MSPSSRRSAPRSSGRARSSAPASSASATPTARRSRARRSGTRARSGSSPSTTTHVWLTRQPREAVGASALARDPGRQARRRGRAAARDRPAGARRGDRQAGRELGGDRRRSTRAPASATSACGSTSPPTLATREPAEAEEDERIEIVPWPLDRLDAAIDECEDSKSLIALLWLASPALSAALQLSASRRDLSASRHGRSRPGQRE